VCGLLPRQAVPQSTKFWHTFPTLLRHALQKRLISLSKSVLCCLPPCPHAARVPGMLNRMYGMAGCKCAQEQRHPIWNAGQRWGAVDFQRLREYCVAMLARSNIFKKCSTTVPPPEFTLCWIFIFHAPLYRYSITRCDVAPVFQFPPSQCKGWRGQPQSKLR
jgi:hypothetical protein